MTHDRTYLLSLVKGKCLQLLFRATRDNWLAKEFHSRCDNKGPTLTLVKTKGARICGGYASVSWESIEGGSFKTDSESYLFTLNPNRTFNINKQEMAIRCDSQWGPVFGLSLYAWLSGSDTCYSNASDNTFGNIKDKDGNSYLTGSKIAFNVRELEVFSVI